MIVEYFSVMLSYLLEVAADIFRSKKKRLRKQLTIHNTSSADLKMFNIQLYISVHANQPYILYQYVCSNACLLRFTICFYAALRLPVGKIDQTKPCNIFLDILIEILYIQHWKNYYGHISNWWIASLMDTQLLHII